MALIGVNLFSWHIIQLKPKRDSNGRGLAPNNATTMQWLETFLPGVRFVVYIAFSNYGTTPCLTGPGNPLLVLQKIATGRQKPLLVLQKKLPGRGRVLLVSENTGGLEF